MLLEVLKKTSENVEKGSWHPSQNFDPVHITHISAEQIYLLLIYFIRCVEIYGDKWKIIDGENVVVFVYET